MNTTTLLILFGLAAVIATAALIIAPIATRIAQSARERRAVQTWVRQQRRLS